MSRQRSAYPVGNRRSILRRKISINCQSSLHVGNSVRLGHVTVNYSLSRPLVFFLKVRFFGKVWSGAHQLEVVSQNISVYPYRTLGISGKLRGMIWSFAFCPLFFIPILASELKATTSIVILCAKFRPHELLYTSFSAWLRPRVF